jgi:hypothetical protein
MHVRVRAVRAGLDGVSMPADFGRAARGDTCLLRSFQAKNAPTEIVVPSRVRRIRVASTEARREPPEWIADPPWLADDVCIHSHHPPRIPARTSQSRAVFATSRIEKQVLSEPTRPMSNRRSRKLRRSVPHDDIQAFERRRSQRNSRPKGGASPGDTCLLRFTGALFPACGKSAMRSGSRRGGTAKSPRGFERSWAAAPQAPPKRSVGPAPPTCTPPPG